MTAPVFRNRGVTADWHLDQARRLLRIALEEESATALIYSALEARNAIERFVFEMSVLATGGRLTDQQLRIARKKQGVFQLLEDALENYRKHIEFQNLIMRSSGTPLQFPVPDLRSCKRLTTGLSDYCHCQFDPAATVTDIEGKWFITGVSLIEDAEKFLRPLLDSPRGFVDKATMPAEVKELLESFLAGTIDPASVLIRLKLMQPILERRSLR